MEQSEWPLTDLDLTSRPQCGIGFVIESTYLQDVARIPLRTTLYACSWAVPTQAPLTEGQHGDGNHHGHQQTAH